jgi:hypothetical protein
MSTFIQSLPVFTNDDLRSICSPEGRAKIDDYYQVRYSAGIFSTADVWPTACAAFPGLTPDVWEAAKSLYTVRIKVSEARTKAVRGGGTGGLHFIQTNDRDLKKAIADRQIIIGSQISSLRELMIAGAAYLASRNYSYDCPGYSLKEAFKGLYPIADSITEVYCLVQYEMREEYNYYSPIPEEILIAGRELKKCLLETAVCAFYEASGLLALGARLRDTPADLSGRDYTSMHQTINDHEASITLEQHQVAAALRDQLSTFGERVAAAAAAAGDGNGCPEHLAIDALIDCVLDDDLRCNSVLPKGANRVDKISGVIDAVNSGFVPKMGPYQERLIELLRKLLDHRVAVAQAKYDEACGQEEARLRCALVELACLTEQEQMATEEFNSRIASQEAHFHHIPDWMVYTAIERKNVADEKRRISDMKEHNYEKRRNLEYSENNRLKKRLDECDVTGMIYWEQPPRKYSCWPPSEEERIMVGDGYRYYAVIASNLHSRSENELYQDGHDLTCINAEREIKVFHLRCTANYRDNDSQGPGIYSQGGGIPSGVIEVTPEKYLDLLALQAEMMPAHSGPILEARAAVKAADDAEEAAKKAVREAAIEERKPFYRLLHIYKLIHVVNEKFPRETQRDAERLYTEYAQSAADKEASLAKYVAEARLRGDRTCDVEWKRIVKECIERAKEVALTIAEGRDFGENYSTCFSVHGSIALEASYAVARYFEPLGVSASPESVAYAIDLARKTAENQVNLWLRANEEYIALQTRIAVEYPQLGELARNYIAVEVRHTMVLDYRGDMEKVSQHTNLLIRRFVKKYDAFQDAYHRAHILGQEVNGHVYRISDEVSQEIAKEVSSIYFNSDDPDSEATATLAETCLDNLIDDAVDQMIAEEEETAAQLQFAQQLGPWNPNDDEDDHSAAAA